MGIQINGQTDTISAIDGGITVATDLTVPGVLSYDDVTNIDSVGVITARNGINVTGGNVTMHSGGRIFIGAGGNAVDPMFAPVSDTNTGIAFPAADTMLFTTGGSERLRITSDGDIKFGTQGSSVGNNSTALTHIDAGREYWSGTAGDYRSLKHRFYYASTDDAYGMGISSNLLEIQSQTDMAFFAGSAGVASGRRVERLRITSSGDTEIRNTVAGITNAYSQSLKFRTTQTNGQSAITGAIAAQGKSSWGGDLVFYTKEANASPGDTVRETLRVDTAGRITKPYQPRFFAWSNNSSNALGTGYRTVDIWNQTRFNVGNHFSTSTNKFTAPIAGCYAFGTQVRFDAADVGYFRLILSINDSTGDNEQAHSITDSGSTGNNYHTMAITALYELSQGDTVKVLAEGNSDSSWTLQSESQFWGYLVA